MMPGSKTRSNVCGFPAEKSAPDFQVLIFGRLDAKKYAHVICMYIYNIYIYIPPGKDRFGATPISLGLLIMAPFFQIATELGSG